MVQLDFENKETFTSLECLTAAAFLGALFCAILGVGIKWFRAQLSFSNDQIESASVQPKIGVYRSYGIDVYNPSYRVYDESPSTSRFPAVKPKLKVTTAIKPNEDNRIEREPEYSEIDSTSQNVQNNNGAIPKDTKTGATPKDKKAKKKGAKKPKAPSQPKTKEEKEEEARLKKLKEEKTKQEKLEKKMLEKSAKEEKARLEKENKAKFEREKRERKEREKELKSNKSKGEKIIASSDMSNNAPIEAIPARPPVHNPLGTADSNYEPIRDFSSSWDMVAAHRRDLKREPIPVAADSGRGMTNPVMATNTLYMPPPIDRRNPVPSERMSRSNMYSNASDQSDKDSDTEA